MSEDGEIGAKVRESEKQHRLKASLGNTGRGVAVGTTVARRPPHSPVLALLTHTVLTLDLGIFGVETHGRIRLQDLDWRQQAAQAFPKAIPT